MADLLPLATAWTCGAVKVVLSDWQLDGAVLRLWVLAGGAPDRRGYLLGLDLHAPGTHALLAVALATAGLAATLCDSRTGPPALRVPGRRRRSRLAELVGQAPLATPTGLWPD